ncbi:MAG TPA: GNAT family N-acetyltransferase [Allosphingosinicella sp.]
MAGEAGGDDGAASILIRAFETADSAAVDAVALEAFEQYRGVYDDWRTLEQAVGRTSAMAADAELLIAEVDGRVAGAVAYCPPFSEPRADFFESRWPLIRMLVVAPSARGRGLGRSLTDACIERARRDGAASIALHTSPAMEVALALYLRMGFRLERRVPDRFGVPYAVYLLDL